MLRQAGKYSCSTRAQTCGRSAPNRRFYLSAVQDSIRGGVLRPLRKLGLVAARHWPWPVLAEINTGRRMFVDLRSGIGRGIYAKGEFDPAVFAPLREKLHSGDTFLDVGANVGFYSMLALDV